MHGQPGDKSPGYYRVSLRDEVKTGFQMSKLLLYPVRLGRILQTLFLAVCFGHQRGEIPIVLNSLDENWDSGADQNQEADDTALPIGRHTQKDERVVDHGYQEDTDQ